MFFNGNIVETHRADKTGFTMSTEKLQGPHWRYLHAAGFTERLEDKCEHKPNVHIAGGVCVCVLGGGSLLIVLIKVWCLSAV